MLYAEGVQFIWESNQREETVSFSPEEDEGFPDSREPPIVWRPIRQEMGASTSRVAKRENLPVNEWERALGFQFVVSWENDTIVAFRQRRTVDRVISKKKKKKKRKKRERKRKKKKNRFVSTKVKKIVRGVH